MILQSLHNDQAILEVGGVTVKVRVTDYGALEVDCTASGDFDADLYELDEDGDVYIRFGRNGDHDQSVVLKHEKD